MAAVNLSPKAGPTKIEPKATPAARCIVSAPFVGYTFPGPHRDARPRARRARVAARVRRRRSTTRANRAGNDPPGDPEPRPSGAVTEGGAG